MPLCLLLAFAACSEDDNTPTDFISEATGGTGQAGASGAVSGGVGGAGKGGSVGSGGSASGAGGTVQTGAGQAGAGGSSGEGGQAWAGQGGSTAQGGGGQGGEQAGEGGAGGVGQSGASGQGGAGVAGQGGGSGCDDVVQEHTFPSLASLSGQEILGQCQSWTLNNPTELWVRRVDFQQDAAVASAVIYAAPSNQFNGPDGTWSCLDRGFSDIKAITAGTLLFAQSYQATEQSQEFACDAAVRIAPYSRVISQIWIKNQTAVDKTDAPTLRFHTIPASSVARPLVPFWLRYLGLKLPPLASSRFFGDADLAAASSPLQFSVHYVLPFAQQRATRTFLEATAEGSPPQVVLDAAMSPGAPTGKTFDPPANLSAAKAVRFGCEYLNPQTDTIQWGYGDQEKCDFFGFAESKTFFLAQVNDANPTSDDAPFKVYTGDCSVIASPWDQAKPGGPPPP